MERFKEDPRSDKVNLSIGLYYNDDGIIPQLQAVAEAEARLNAEPHGASLYLPMEGLSGYRQAIAPLLFGAEHTALKQNRIASIQTVGGSGALKVGADFLKRYFPESHVWVSDPTRENHIAIFEGAGFEVSTYPGLIKPPTACALRTCWRRCKRCRRAILCCCTLAATTRPAPTLRQPSGTAWLRY